MKRIEFDEEVREKLLNGVRTLERAVGSTLGAKGRNVIFQIGNTYGVTKDGATVAANIDVEDPVENAAIQIVKEAASRTARDAGDGTTTSTVLAASMIEQAMEHIRHNANPMDIKRGIDLAVYDIISEVEKMVHEVDEDSDDIFNIAAISSNGDPVIATMISDIFKKIGKTGVVRLEHTQMTETVNNVIEGCQFNAGMLSPNFATKSGGEAEYNDPLIFITDKKFEGSFAELVPVMEIAIEQQSPLLIVCGGMEGETLGTLVINKVKKQLPVVVMVAPEFGDKRIEILKDIAAITGGSFISEAQGDSIAEIKLEDFGSADHVISNHESTTIIGRHGDPEKIKVRVDEIEEQLQNDMHMQETWRLKRRIASLTGGIGVIYVGGNSETEMKESYYRFEDALAATKAALESGYVAGGGMAYLQAGSLVRERAGSFENSDINHGYRLALKSMLNPFFKIVENCGVDVMAVYNRILSGNSHSVVHVLPSTNKDERISEVGYNATTGEVVDLIKHGIIDPFKVVVTAIKNAASVAGMILTTNTVVYDYKP